VSASPVLLSVVVSLRCLWVLECPASFPPTYPSLGAPFPPRGPLENVPPFPWYFDTAVLRYYGALRLPATPPAALRCLRLAVPFGAPVFAPSRPGHAASKARAVYPVSLTAFSDGDDRISQVPGEPPCTHAGLFDPGGAFTPSQLRTVCRCGLPLFRRRRPPRGFPFRGSITAAYVLPVYASQHGSPRHHATLGSGRWLTVAGQGCNPAGFL